MPPQEGDTIACGRYCELAWHGPNLDAPVTAPALAHDPTEPTRSVDSVGPMELHDQIREALELQAIEADGEGAARVIQAAIMEHTAIGVGDSLLDAGAIVLRRMVLETEQALVAPDLLSRLALDGAVPEERIELLTDTMTMAAATAGGIRPSVEALITRVGVENAMFGLWLGLLTLIRVTAMVLDHTEAELVEEVLHSLEPF